MKLNLPIVAAALFLPLTASAGSNVDLAIYLGKSFPTYSQTFAYSPGPVSVPIAGVSITQSGGFTVEGSGGWVVSGGVSFYLAGVIGIEARKDTIRVDLQHTLPHYDVSLALPGIAQPVTASLDLPPGTFDLSTLKPWSLNLKLRTSAPVRFFASGGLSRLPSFEFTGSQDIGLGVTGIDTVINKATIARVGISGALVPTEGTGSKWGVNVGAGLQFEVSKNITIVGEARYFYFKKQEFEWTVTADRPLSAIEQTLYNATLQRLDPVEFAPQLFQVTAGVTLSF